MKILLPFILFFSFCQFLHAQQLPIFTQYRHYGGLINPADIPTSYFSGNSNSRLFGNDRFIKISGGQRLQWFNNIKSARITTSVVDGTGIWDLDGVSLLGGGYLVYDKVGATQTSGIYGRTAIYLGKPGSTFRAGLGFNGGFIRHVIDINALSARSATDPLLANLDSEPTPDLGVGGFGIFQWDNNNKLLFGLSALQLIEGKNNFVDNNYDYYNVRHYYGQLSFITNNPLSPSYSFWEFSLWAKYLPGLPMNVDFIFKSYISSNAWVGGGVNTNGNLHVEIGFLNPLERVIDFDRSESKWQLGLGADFSVFNSALPSNFGHTLEINLAYIIN